MANSNPNPSTRFTKGDPRINRKGRPKSFDALRELAQAIAHEEVKVKGTNEPLIINGHKVSVAEMILRNWAISPRAEIQKAFMEVAFGKVPDNVDITSDGKAITLKVVYDE